MESEFFASGPDHQCAFFTHLKDPFFSGIARSIEQASSLAKYNLVVCNTDEVQEKEIQLVHTLLGRGIDGLILAPVQDCYQHIQDLYEKRFPLVLIDRCFENIDTNAVISNNEQAAYHAVAYLAKVGHRRVGFISGRKNIYTICQRFSGYKKAIRDYHLDDEPFLLSENGFTAQSGYQSTLKLLSIDVPPTALLVSGNLITVGTMQAILKKGLKIPHDISIIGFTDFICSSFWLTPLSTITHPLQEMGHKAFDLLLTHMQAKEPLTNSKIIVKTKLTLRDSVRNLA